MKLTTRFAFIFAVLALLFAMPALASPEPGVAAAAGACAIDTDCAAPAAAAVAPAVPDAASQPVDFVKAVFEAGQNRQWLLLGVMLMLGIIALLRKFSGVLAVKFAGNFVGRFCAFLLTDRGGTFLAFFSTVLAWIAAGLGAGATADLSLFINAIGAGFTAIGTYVGLKRMAFPSGEDKAQVVAANAAAVGLAASESSEAAVEQLKAGLAKARAAAKPAAAKPVEDLK